MTIASLTGLKVVAIGHDKHQLFDAPCPSICLAGIASHTSKVAHSSAECQQSINQQRIHVQLRRDEKGSEVHLSVAPDPQAQPVVGAEVKIQLGGAVAAEAAALRNGTFRWASAGCVGCIGLTSKCIAVPIVAWVHTQDLVIGSNSPVAVLILVEPRLRGHSYPCASCSPPE